MTSKCMIGIFTSCIASMGLAQPPLEYLDPYWDSTRLVQKFGVHVAVSDYDEDGRITDSDLILMLADPKHFIAMADFDDDGKVDTKDCEQTVRNLLHGMAGDFDLSGTVDLGDLAILVDHELDVVGTRDEAASKKTLPLEFGTLSIVGVDSAMGVQVSSTDLDAVLSKFATGQFEIQEEVDEIVAIMSEHGICASASVLDHDSFFSGMFPPHNRRPVLWPPNHAPAFTNRWGEPVDGIPRHAITTSTNRWPANHRNDISLGWEPARPDWHTPLNSALYWPPSHLIVPSRTWAPPSEDNENGHSIESSRYWPPSHLFANSGTTEHRSDWSMLSPNDQYPLPKESPHVLVISGTWEPTHDRAFSADDPNGWPPNHTAADSGTKPIHYTDISNHGWPGNHDVNISRDWSPSGHSYSLSALWPPSHYQELSNTWPEDERNNWPANHTVASSTLPGTPVPDPLPLFFPGDHSLFTTAKDLIDIVAP